MPGMSYVCKTKTEVLFFGVRLRKPRSDPHGAHPHFGRRHAGAGCWPHWRSWAWGGVLWPAMTAALTVWPPAMAGSAAGQAPLHNLGRVLGRAIGTVLYRFAAQGRGFVAGWQLVMRLLAATCSSLPGQCTAEVAGGLPTVSTTGMPAARAKGSACPRLPRC